ncbi:hypothetical protein VB712_17530 [Spirulina sp. CCNP1310]|uniref:hypothetical protein n=1 Tax=Spirulina sp. CCNP1310 TaxID=3110249 RepID=UPI002B1FA71A|nr:hypothetical protein [Spirulina sp. CCNP1310]MEA5421030.1 hypothetical protein [Spirulina sp. CCNP1310]
MDVLIESTQDFEKDLKSLSDPERNIAIQKINDCAALFPEHQSNGYRKLRRICLPSGLSGYESSVFTLRVSQKLRVILAVDEDPIFDQFIFTLFRVVKRDEIEQVYRGIAESLYQEIRHHDRELATIS